MLVGFQKLYIHFVEMVMVKSSAFQFQMSFQCHSMQLTVSYLKIII